MYSFVKDTNNYFIFVVIQNSVEETYKREGQMRHEK